MPSFSSQSAIPCTAAHPHISLSMLSGEDTRLTVYRPFVRLGRRARPFPEPPVRFRRAERKPLASYAAGALLRSLLQSATYHTNGAAQQLIVGARIRPANGEFALRQWHFVGYFGGVQTYFGIATGFGNGGRMLHHVDQISRLGQRTCHLTIRIQRFFCHLARKDCRLRERSYNVPSQRGPARGRLQCSQSERPSR